MMFFLASVSKNLRRVIAAPWSVAIWIGVPLLVGALLSAVLGGTATETARIHLLIADEDNSVLSRLLLNALDTDDLAQFLLPEPVTIKLGTATLDQGDASAMLIIPAGFQTAFLASEPQALQLVVNPLQSILPEMAEELARLIADFGSYAQMALGPELAATAQLIAEIESGKIISNAAANAVATLSHGVATKLFHAFPYLTRAPLEIELVTTEGARETSFTMLFFPGLLMMSVIFAAQGLAEDLWQEREMGTLRRLKSTAAPVFGIFAARIFASAVVLLIVVLPLSFIGFAMLDLPWGKLPLALFWLISAGLMLTALAGLIQVMAPSRKAGSLYSTLVFFPLLLVGGSFFPFEAMPGSLASFGRLTPNGMMLEPLKRYLIGTGDLSAFGPVFILALVAILGLTALTAQRVTTTFSNR